jgi:DNA-binding CsgD family transcriptional regulator
VLAECTPARIVERTGALRLEVSSVVVRLALLHVAETAGWCRCNHTASCACVSITDGPGGSTVDVLVVQDRPAACQEAVRKVMGGQARGAVLWDEPESLLTVLEGFAHDSVVISRRVIDLASAAPAVSERQLRTLRLVAMGRSNHGIAASLGQSVSTVKREIAELLRVFDAPNRAALLTAAAELGFIGQRRPAEQIATGY